MHKDREIVADGRITMDQRHRSNPKSSNDQTKFRDINLHGETTFSNSQNKPTHGQIENACPTSITQLIKSKDEENSAL